MPAISENDDAHAYAHESNIQRYLLASSIGSATSDLLKAATHERWSVKTGSDAGAETLTTQAPTETSVTALISLPRPSVLPLSGRSIGAEQTVFKVTTTIRGYHAESDGDFHLVIGDDSTKTMIAEIPKPSAITSPSYFAEEIATARTAFDAHFGISERLSVTAEPSEPTEFQAVTVPVILTGLGFFDFPHHQTGVAPNAIELHPVIGIVFQV